MPEVIVAGLGRPKKKGSRSRFDSRSKKTKVLTTSFFQMQLILGNSLVGLGDALAAITVLEKSRSALPGNAAPGVFSSVIACH